MRMRCERIIRRMRMLIGLNRNYFYRRRTKATRFLPNSIIK